MCIAFIVIGMMIVIYLHVSNEKRRMENVEYRSTNATRAAGNEANMSAER
jgi:hypothetical protein